MRLPPRPVIYEINTAVWLDSLAQELGRDLLLLDEVPQAVWDELGALPVDAVWLMGVWQRSAVGRDIARGDADLMAQMHRALPDLRDDDIVGSPYCVRDYVVDERFGGPEGLAVAREELAQRGLGLILDFVPNHVAPDHRWLHEAPGRFIGGTAQEYAARPDAFIEVDGHVFARGSDPNLASWPDVVQLNASSADLRAASTEVLQQIASQCDGVRCDMAMLMCNDVFPRTWGERGGPAPQEEFWPQVIGAVKGAHPGFTFIAEVYWGMERRLQQEGFDYGYDKGLYDALVEGDADAVRSSLRADLGLQDGLLRFIENHDEQRAASVFGPARERAAAVVLSTVPGARMYHHGQFEGFGAHVPVFLGRGPRESADTGLREFYLRLLDAVRTSGLREGRWSPADVRGLPGDDSWRGVVAWGWDGPAGRHLVAVNLGGTDARARVRAPWFEELRGREWTLRDMLDGSDSRRDGDELASTGLDLALGPWQFHLFACDQS